MAKYTNVLREKSGSDYRSNSRRGLLKLLLVLGLILSPLAFEGVKVVAARWGSILGTHQEVETPIWNQLVAAYRSGADEWYYRVGRGIEPGQWSAGMAVPAVIVVAIASTFFLRNTTR
ncbi:MAG: hypothetical protein AB7I30_06630 [Isosphaeraceae bacterium]